MLQPLHYKKFHPHIDQPFVIFRLGVALANLCDAWLLRYVIAALSHEFDERFHINYTYDSKPSLKQ